MADHSKHPHEKKKSRKNLEKEMDGKTANAKKKKELHTYMRSALCLTFRPIAAFYGGLGFGNFFGNVSYDFEWNTKDHVLGATVR